MATIQPIRVPLAPKFNLIGTSAACPDGGILYIGFKSVNYISAIKEDETPIIKTISTRQNIQSIGCDPDWSETKYFAALADDNTIQIWDVEDCKAKKGHKAHIKTPAGDGDGPTSDYVAMCFLKNRTILSIDSSSIVKYCVNSNRYTKCKRIINVKHKIIIAQGSPSDDNIIAFGSTRGLVFLVNLATETILFTFCGHAREVTSFSWLVIPIAATVQPRPIKVPAQKSSRRQVPVHNTTVDDVFDIYDYDYLENEFGAPVYNDKKTPSDKASTENNDQAEDFSNENFNFMEACKSLKDDILARKLDEDRDDSVVNQSRQVTLEDCRQAIEDRVAAGESSECDSELSVEFPESFGDDSFLDEFQKSCAINSSNLDRSGIEKEKIAQEDVFLASASIDGSIWIWNTKTGASVDQISLKGTHSQNVNNNYIEVYWLNSNTLIFNDKACELAIYSGNLSSEKKHNFTREKYESKHKGVVNICKIHNSTMVWILSFRRELICEDLISKKILAKYACGVAGIAAFRENPSDMSRIAIAFSDRRIGLLPLAIVTPRNIPIESWSLKEDAQIVALSWCPNDKHLAFGTAEGRIGVIDTEKLGSPIVLMKPFSGKPIYSLCWSDKRIFACSQEKIVYYEWNGKPQHAIKLENITRASTIVLHDNLLLVGNQIGDVVLHLRSERASNIVTYEPAGFKNVFSKYIKVIEFNPLNPTLIAVSAQSRNVVILKLIDLSLEVYRTLGANESHSSGTNTSLNSVKWSNKNEDLLLTCGFDGTVRVWDLSQTTGNELIFVKKFDSPMLCAIFCPTNEDIILCAGRATSIEMFDYKKEESDILTKTSKEKNKDKHLGDVQWGTRLENALPSKKKSKQKQKQEENEEEDAKMVERLKQLNGEDTYINKTNELIPGLSSNVNPSTILYLLAKEFNKDPLQNINKLLNDSSESPLLAEKLFGSRTDVEDVLKAELKNHKNSRTCSIGQIIIPQATGDLLDEIIECMKSKKLTEFHVSLAPTISYDFWKKCCEAYAQQLLEVGLALNATSYLLACHDVRESINQLMAKHYFGEAWIIAKVHIDGRDVIFDTVFKKWVEHLVSNGNYEGASLLYTLAGDYKGAHKCLSERRQQNDEHNRIMNILESKFSS